MKAIAKQFDKIAADVQKKLDNADDFMKGVLIGGGVGLGVAALGVLAAPFTGGASLVVSAGALAGSVGGVAALGLFTCIVKALIESGGARDLEKLGKEFMELARPLNDHLREIKTLSNRLQQNAIECVFMGKLNEIQRLFTRVTDVSEQVYVQMQRMMEFMGDLVRLVLIILKKISSPEQDKELTEKIVKSGTECWKTIREFQRMKEELQSFRDRLQFDSRSERYSLM